MMNWLQKLFYKLSGHDAKKESWEHELALRAMCNLGIEIGEKHVPAPVMTHGTCRKHPLVLLNERGHGDYCCMMCKEEERHTDRIQPLRPMNIYNDALRTGSGPQTAIHKAVGRLTQPL